MSKCYLVLSTLLAADVLLFNFYFSIESLFDMHIILGGGISGLSAAFYLVRSPRTKQSIKLFEASNRFGGWIKTEYSANNKNIRFELGPRTIRPSGIKGWNTLQLISDIQLDKTILPIKSSDPASTNRMIYVDGKLCILPSTLLSTFKKLPPFTKPLISSLIHDIRNKKTHSLPDDTIYNFTQRRFGDDVAKYLISSMICGICAGDAKEISVKFLMQELFEYEKKYGSVCTGLIKTTWSNRHEKPAKTEHLSSPLVEQSRRDKWRMYSLNNGLETLPNKLCEHLAANSVELYKSSNCEKITIDKNAAQVRINGQDYETHSLISSLPAYEMGKLLQEKHKPLANELLAIPYVDVAVVNLQFSGDNLLPTPGFGFLVPPSQNLPILGVIYDSCCSPVQGNTVLTVMMGGKWFDERLGRNITEDAVMKIAIKEVQRILKIDKDPVECRANILRKCIPQYVVGHHDRINRIYKYVKDNKLPIRLCGSAYDGVGINDVIYSAKKAVESFH